MPHKISKEQPGQWSRLGLPGTPDFGVRYASLPMVGAIVDERGLPIAAPTFFLLSQAIKSSGATGDTTRTYGEALLPWLRFLASREQNILSATEEDLKLFRAEQMWVPNEGGRRRATSTTNLRVTVAAAFHRWCQRNAYESPLGAYLLSRSKGDRSLSARTISRHPRVLSAEEISRLMILARAPYRLAFRWGLVTGVRRFEAAFLRVSDLPLPEQLPHFEDRLASLTILRKGGREQTIYAPVGLVEETQWYVKTERHDAAAGFEDHIFISTRGSAVGRQAMSREFHRCAQLIGTDATLHHLRHTFAISVLSYLQRRGHEDHGVNSLKVVQVLLGHSSAQTTEIYLRAATVTNSLVVDALDFLYGANI